MKTCCYKVATEKKENKENKKNKKIPSYGTPKGEEDTYDRKQR